MKKLNKMHRQAIELILDGSLTMDEIAKSVKKTRKTIYNWMDDDVFKAELAERNKQRESAFKARLQRNAGLALDRARDILKSGGDEKAVAAVISDTLDRAGYPKIKAADLKDEQTEQKGGVIFIPEAEVSEDAGEQ